MTDIELTRLTAEAMGIPFRELNVLGSTFIVADTDEGNLIYLHGHGACSVYNPLKDDAQAMALVKKFELRCRTYIKREWQVWAPDQAETTDASNGDLNRAICECLAKMQQAKAKP